MKEKAAAVVLKHMKRLRSTLGFTLAELMIAMLIMSMVTAVAAGGIPVAINAYTKVVDTANAQVLLSTTMTKLREELGTAVEIKLPEITENAEDGTIKDKSGKSYEKTSDEKTYTYSDDEYTIVYDKEKNKVKKAVIRNKKIVFESENGSESWIYCVTKAEADADADKKAGINIREYADIRFDGEAADPDRYLHLLISKSAANKNLYVTFGNIEWIPEDGILEIKNVEVWSNSGTKLADLVCAENENGSIKIRVLSYIY